ncbi:MAG TPA: C1 family peptidase, partial [Anaerolineae bacterium]|nr:C1 family peptidase [Anaerolineae bacterium]
MKANRRTRWIVSAALFSLVLTFVSLLSPSTALPQAGTPGPVLLGPSDDGSQVELRADQFLALRLEANPAAGYGWYVQDMDGAVLRQVGEPEMDGTPVLLGAPTIVTLRFSPQAAGQSPLVLAYRRPGDEAEPLKTFSLEVRAAGAYVGTETLEAAAAPVDAPAADLGDEATADLPAALNWCTAVGCTPVRDQGACGSCWAFGTAGVLEQNIRIVDGVSKDLSEQYLLSCNTDGWSCDGGWWAHDYNWWKVPPGEPGPGAVTEAAFPYLASRVACNPPHTHNEQIADWKYVGTANSVPTVAALKQAIYDRGPIAVAVCAGSRFSSYSGGVLTTGDVCSKPVNHGVVLVGWDDSLGTNGAWILRNSWGPGWGEGGYMKIAYGISNVGYGATYVVRGTMPHSASAPSNLRAVSVSTSRIDLRWTDTSSNETG